MSHGGNPFSIFAVRPWLLTGPESHLSICRKPQTLETAVHEQQKQIDHRANIYRSQATDIEQMFDCAVSKDRRGVNLQEGKKLQDEPDDKK